jgi:hypothetical protein
MLTHQNERPEKCPIPTCEYHTKGFARKYDKNRHTLTHYKGTMICSFCPGSGSSAEKSFNRADVFKRHLTSVHGVEQTPPNARRKSPTGGKQAPYSNVRDVSGMCSTCGVMFANAQEFYEHLDDCVLRVVQQAEPSEAINERLLMSVVDDPAVHASMKKHNLPTTVEYDAPASYDEEEEDDEQDAAAEEDIDDDALDGTYGTRSGRSGNNKTSSRPRRSAGTSKWQSTHSRSDTEQRNGSSSTNLNNNNNHITTTGSIGKPRKQGLTHSKNGVTLSGPPALVKGGKRKKNYPLSWGAAPQDMHMKKRVLCVFDGPRRLWKDDMMLDTAHEVRVPVAGGDGRAYTTDLDILTMRRAEAIHNATEEEKGPWLDEDGREVVLGEQWEASLLSFFHSLVLVPGTVGYILRLLFCAFFLFCCVHVGKAKKWYHPQSRFYAVVGERGMVTNYMHDLLTILTNIQALLLFSFEREFSFLLGRRRLYLQRDEGGEEEEDYGEDAMLGF